MRNVRIFRLGVETCLWGSVGCVALGCRCKLVGNITIMGACGEIIKNKDLVVNDLVEENLVTVKDDEDFDQVLEMVINLGYSLECQAVDYGSIRIGLKISGLACTPLYCRNKEVFCAA